MKKSIIILLFIFFGGISATAQFTSGVLQASGLTCAMCTKAINNSLEELPFIHSIKADIKNSLFNISFKPGASIQIDRLKEAVQEAGFSVARLKLAANFTNVGVGNDEHIQLNGETFHFLNVKDQTLNGNSMITIVDKNFLPGKEYKKYREATKMQCVHTGRAGACCGKEISGANTRIYHATI